jgi:hypothetical protein
MAEAQEARGNWIAGGDGSLIKDGAAKDAYDALGEANRSIFGDIYPNHRFYELYGWDGVMQCGDYPGHKIPQDLKDAFKKMEDANIRWGADKARTLREASNKIAEYEQKVVVQKAVYGVDRFKKVLESNEYWSSSWRTPLGWFAGAKTPQLALSAECGGGESILFDGSINNPDDRVNYYHKLMNEWTKQRDANPTGWSKMYDDIIDWSQGRSKSEGGFFDKLFGGSSGPTGGDFGGFGGGSSGGGGASGTW